MPDQQVQVLLGWSWNGEHAARRQRAAASAVVEAIEKRRAE
jgi:hypothetical protein